MTTIDQRILIPAGSQAVWEQISNIANNPKWQVDCRSISFLTSLREGPKLRWRSTSTQNHESVLEVTAWYDGLGYEYIYVDGSPFSECRGRIRLQEIAEGTIVQWTIEYQLAGVLGSLRNSLSLKRQVETTMTASLKQLWRFISESGAQQRFHESKAVMQEALDYEQRSQYRPRHRSIFAERVEAAPGPRIPEPPVEDDDTRPNPAVVVKPETVAAAPPIIPPGPAVPEPDFLIDLPPQSAPAEFKAFQRPVDTPAPLEPARAEPVAMTPPSPMPAVRIEPIAPPAAEIETAHEIFKPPVEPKPQLEARELPIPPSIMEPETPDEPSKLESAQLSIWEIFGVPRPSETREIPQVTLPQTPTRPPEPLPDEKVESLPVPVEAELIPGPEVVAAAAEVEIAPVAVEAEIVLPAAPTVEKLAAAPIRIGLRAALRRKNVKLRWK